MSTDLINQITLHYLTKTTKLSEVPSTTVNRTEKKFYRKRIYNLTRYLLTSSDVTVNNDVKSAFDNYLNTCIYYFKNTDNNDILQKEYQNDLICDDKLCDEKKQDETNQEYTNANQLMMRTVTTSLDKFLKKKRTAKPIILPQQKEVDLNNPELMTKGIRDDRKRDDRKRDDRKRDDRKKKI